jgi:hypothetical protein
MKSKKSTTTTKGLKVYCCYCDYYGDNDKKNRSELEMREEMLCVIEPMTANTGSSAREEINEDGRG